MALTRNITRSDGVYTGTNVAFPITLYEDKTKTVAKNAVGMALSWLLKRNRTDTDAAAKLTKTTANGGISVTGVFNPSPALNTQVVTVSLSRADTAALSSTSSYYHELKRTDTNVETVLVEGTFMVAQAVHR